MSEVLKNGLEGFFLTYGLRPKKEVDYDKLYKFLKRRRFNIENTNEIYELLYSLIKVHSDCFYVICPEKYFENRVTTDVEDIYKEAMGFIFISLKPKKDKILLIAERTLLSEITKEYDKCLEQLSDTWAITKTFGDDRYRQKIGQRIFLKEFSNHTNIIKSAIRFRLPQYVLNLVERQEKIDRNNNRIMVDTY